MFLNKGQPSDKRFTLSYEGYEKDMFCVPAVFDCLKYNSRIKLPVCVSAKLQNVKDGQVIDASDWVYNLEENNEISVLTLRSLFEMTVELGKLQDIGLLSTENVICNVHTRLGFQELNLKANKNVFIAVKYDDLNAVMYKDIWSFYMREKVFNLYSLCQIGVCRKMKDSTLDILSYRFSAELEDIDTQGFYKAFD